MFVFYFGVASSITPPVALTAYAAAAISGGRPIQTGVAAVRIGLIIFALPFFWAYNPMMLVVPQTGVPFEMVEFLFILVRLVAMTYLLASGTSRFDARPLHPAESTGRVVLGLLMIVPSPLVWGSALIAMMPSVPLSAIYRGVIPFVLAQIVLIVIVFLLPDLVTWLPDTARALR